MGDIGVGDFERGWLVIGVFLGFAFVLVMYSLSAIIKMNAMRQVYVFSGRASRWERDLTIFVKAGSLEQAERVFRSWVVERDKLMIGVRDDGEGIDDVVVSYGHSVVGYSEHLIR